MPDVQRILGFHVFDDLLRYGVQRHLAPQRFSRRFKVPRVVHAQDGLDIQRGRQKISGFFPLDNADPVSHIAYAALIHSLWRGIYDKSGRNLCICKRKIRN